MNFEPQTIYHIYNQGNNRQQIFFSEENYFFFLKKMRQFLLPYGDLLCYCLMPNHFHWLFYLKNLLMPGVVPLTLTVDPTLRSINDSIGILLRSYTRAINKQENRTGSLFRKETKAKDGWPEEIVFMPTHAHHQPKAYWNEFGWTCFQYIHNNPVRARLVRRPEDWRFSSCQDYTGRRSGTLCNQLLAKELLNLP